ncbi:MAG: ArsC family reductase [Undibacterium umbellatum]|uniref:ArsC family reductase n=1 Tax=Undibacterium umbellatum TaxID=2762300 RepID=UPI003BB62215
MTRSITLFGIPNCDTVKKARTWLQEQELAFEFHDFKKQGLNRAAIETWLEHQSLDVLINRKGTTWRALSDTEKASAADTEQAIALMLDKPSVIKRPVLLINNDGKSQVNVGFSVPQYQSIFHNYT